MNLPKRDAALYFAELFFSCNSGLFYFGMHSVGALLFAFLVLNIGIFIYWAWYMYSSNPSIKPNFRLYENGFISNLRELTAYLKDTQPKRSIFLIALLLATLCVGIFCDIWHIFFAISFFYIYAFISFMARRQTHIFGWSYITDEVKENV